MLRFVNKVLIFLTKPDRFSPKTETSTKKSRPILNTAHLSSTLFRNDLNTVQTLLQSRTNPNTLHRANTPLMWAADEGYNDIYVALLNADAETDRLNAAH